MDWLVLVGRRRFLIPLCHIFKFNHHRFFCQMHQIVFLRPSLQLLRLKEVLFHNIISWLMSHTESFNKVQWLLSATLSHFGLWGVSIKSWHILKYAKDQFLVQVSDCFPASELCFEGVLSLLVVMHITVKRAVKVHIVIFWRVKVQSFCSLHLEEYLLLAV